MMGPQSLALIDHAQAMSPARATDASFERVLTSI